MKIFKKGLVLFGLFVCGVAATGNPAPAKYDMRCSPLSERIGHPVPGLYPSLANSIINEFPVYTVPEGKYLRNIGYLYSTWGNGHGQKGILYFLGVDRVTPNGHLSFSSVVTTTIDRNSSISDPQALTLRLRAVLLKAFGRQTSAQDKRIMSIRIAQPCFSSNWDGKYK